MATRCMTSLFRDDTPLPMLQFAQGCLLPTRSRPPGAWQLVGEFDDLVDRLNGPRHTRPFRRCEIRLDGQRA
nr:hypothetical protein [Micromonospora sp. DSM 115978]